MRLLANSFTQVRRNGQIVNVSPEEEIILFPEKGDTYSPRAFRVLEEDKKAPQVFDIKKASRKELLEYAKEKNVTLPEDCYKNNAKTDEVRTALEKALEEDKKEA